MEIQSVGLKSVTFDDDSKKLIQIRSEGAMLSDPSIREGYVQGAAARGIESAGANAARRHARLYGRRYRYAGIRPCRDEPEQSKKY